MLLRCLDKSLDLSAPQVMGILNLTPDSFHDGGKFINDQSYLFQTEKMLREGAAIIDLGGMSSRPGAEIIAPEEEMRRVLPALEEIRLRFPETILSIDTIHVEVADAALKAGVHIVNDISGGTHDPKMITTVAQYGAAFIIMHKKGNPADMQQHPEYVNVVQEVNSFFSNQIEICRKAGLDNLVLDPGFGFGKSLEHNYTLLRQLGDLKPVGKTPSGTGPELPLMVGLSRKSMVCKPLQIKPESALNGTTALHILALMNGANLLRVHDVKEAKEVIRLWLCYRGDYFLG